jgi:Mg-chelatase subunit ChlD
MKLQLQTAIDTEAMRRITDAVLRADLGSRVNFEPEAKIVRIENWLSVGQTVEVIAASGFAVAAVVDASNSMRTHSRLNEALEFTGH